MTFDEYIQTTGMDFNAQQRTAMQRINGATLILAVPGSGKTATVIGRIGYMVKALGIDPESILTITYTRAATASMKKRYDALFGGSDKLEFRTIHGLCAKILSFFEYSTGRKVFTLIDSEGEVHRIMRTIYAQLAGTPANQAELCELATKVTYHRNMLSAQSQIEKESVDFVNFADFFNAYKQYKLENKLMDHDDQLEYAYSILRNYPEILRSFRRRYKYINVDEAQDTSKLQHEIIRILADKNIFMVGDEDQSIYGFRAAYPEMLLNFDKFYENGQVLLMETNYRSTEPITAFANSFIKHNELRYDKCMRSTKSFGKKPELISLHDFSGISDYLVAVAKKTQAQTAILYRNNENALPVIDSFYRSGIDFNLQGRDRAFFTSRTVIDFMRMLKFVMNPHDEALFMQVYYLFKVGMSRENAESTVLKHRKNKKRDLMETAADNELTQYRFIPRLKLLPEQIKRCAELRTADAIRFCAYNLMYRHTFFTCDASDYHKYHILLTLAERYPDKKEFTAHLSELEDMIGRHQDNSANLITLSTIHSAKGLEYDRVFMIDVKAGTLPAQDAEKITAQEEKKAYEEERRLFYVAATRAKRELLIFTSDRENGSPCERSRFIDEAFCLNPPQKKAALQPALSLKNRKIKEKACEPEKAKLSEEEQRKLKESLIVGSVIMHSVFGKCLILTNNGSVMRIKVFSDKSIKPIHIETAVKKGLIAPADAAET